MREKEILTLLFFGKKFDNLLEGNKVIIQHIKSRLELIAEVIFSGSLQHFSRARIKSEESALSFSRAQ